MYRLNNIKTQYTIHRMSKYLSAKYGQLKRVEVYDNQEIDSNFNITNCLFYKRRLNNYDNEIIFASGASMNKYKSLISAFGEALERETINSYVINKNLLIENKSYNELKSYNFKAIEPEAIKLYADFQYKLEDFNFVKFERDTKITWIWANNLMDNNEELIPINFMWEYFGENRIMHATSSGLACGDSKEDSMLRALYEVIERDSICFAWWSKVSFPLIDMNSLEFLKIEGIQLKKYLGRHFKNIKLIDMTTDIGIPVVAAVYISENKIGEPAFLISAACNLDPIKAIEKALSEILHCYYGCKRLLSEIKDIDYKDFDKEIIDFEDHIKYYILDDNIDKVEFLYNSKKTIGINEMSNDFSKSTIENLKLVISKLNNLNYEAFHIDLTPDIYLPNKLYVSKCIIPGLVQLDGVHKYRFIGNERLYKLKRKLGLCDYDMKLEDLNLYPHPFP